VQSSILLANVTQREDRKFGSLKRLLLLGEFPHGVASHRSALSRKTESWRKGRINVKETFKTCHCKQKIKHPNAK